MFSQPSYASVPPEPPLSQDNVRFLNLSTALDEINEGAVFLDSDGQLVWHNRAFDKLLIDNREGHELVAVVIDFAVELLDELADSSAGQAGEVSTVREATIGRIEHELFYTLLPEGMLARDQYLLCLVKRSASRWSSYGEHLRQTWGLTERESQVAVECLRGKKNLEIAEQLRISVETVNKHLDKVYQKANVRGRTELASRLLDSNI